MKDVIYKTVVIYDFDGHPMYCATLEPVTELLTPELSVYSDSSTNLKISGEVKVRESYGKQHLEYYLHGVDPQCSYAHKTPHYGCGIYITDGYDCAHPGKALWDKKYSLADPWMKPVKYVAKEDDSTKGKGDVYTGLRMDEVVGRPLVVHDYNGNVVSCSVLLPHPYGTDEPVCKPVPAPAPAPFVISKKAECFPADAFVVLPSSQRGRLLDQSIGDDVLVQKVTGGLAFEPILGFVHSLSQQTGQAPQHLVLIEHEFGELRVTANHLLFVDGRDMAADYLAVGQRIRRSVDDNEAAADTSRVLAVSRDLSDSGLISPVTASGSVVVEGIVASTYAITRHVAIHHVAMHASFFFLRSHRVLARFVARPLPRLLGQWKEMGVVGIVRFMKTA
eukprot:TRINITY_DN3929_c0_g1_i4.p1 TRINITY_DN3929_c0_g1~~TRINITY_DN3929_c0_g1_i4.p1  ORF type:complete len:391 (+),score=56.72 TRINITY_DN3929_c0_g1_i4:1832-3004(+)